MNNYPEWWDKSITVFNKYEDPETHMITWYRTVLSGCFWKYSENKITVGETTLETAITLCRVPINDRFLEKYEWEKLLPEASFITSDGDEFMTADDEDFTVVDPAPREHYFTFGPGDIIVKGVVDDEVNEYQKDKRSSDLMKKYKNLQGCMLIQRCSINTGSGRGNEHYLVKGV